MTLAFLFAIAYLPGAIIFRLPIADRQKRSALPAEERVFWAVMISIILSTSAVFVLAAMSAYTLQRLVVIDLVISAIAAGFSFGNLRLGADSPQPTWTALLPVGIAVLGGWMYFAAPASEYVLGGRDPGVYMNEGVQIAQRRSLVTVDTLAASVPAATRDLFFPPYGQEGYYSVRFMGFHLRDPETGTVSGQFPQGYPAWISVAYGLDGITGSRRVIAWWAVLGLVSVYFAAARLMGPVPAFAGAALLAVHVIQTWYARYPNSEIVTQALVFAAVLAHTRAHEDDDIFFGPIAASLLGLALFTRLPVVLTVGAAVAASLLAYANGHRPRAGFLATLALWIGVAGLYYTTQLRPYFLRPLAYIDSLQLVHFVMLGTGLAATAVLLWVIRRPAIAAATRTWLPRGCVACVIVGSVYALYFRQPGGHLAPHDAYALREFVDLYFSRIAFGLAIAGYAIVVWRSFWRAPALILVITLLAGFFFYKMRIWPENFWLARRFLTEILPGAVIFAAAALFSPLLLTSRLRLVSGAVGLIATAILGAHYLSAAEPLRNHIEYAGIIPKLEQLAGRFGDTDLVLVESRSASDVHTLGLPLSYIYARNVLVLADSRPDKNKVSEFLGWARERYQNVYFIAGGGTDLLAAGIGAATIATERFQVPEYEKTVYNVYPRRSVMKPFDFTVYKLTASGSEPAPQSLDIGGTDDLNLLDFYPKERLGGGNVTFRWTQDTSYLVMKIDSTSRELMLRLSGGRPRGVPPPHVDVQLAGKTIGSAEPTNDFREYVFRIPDEIASGLAARGPASQIEIRSSTWVPQKVLGGSDTRALGVMVDLAEIR